MSHNIPLLTIKYNESKNITKILTDQVKVVNA